MIVARRHVRPFSAVAAVAWVLSLATAALLLRTAYFSFSVEEEGIAKTFSGDSARPTELRPSLFSVLAPGGDSDFGSSELNKRYRLAGTFLATGAIGAEAPRAILEEKATGRQRVVRPADTLPEGVIVEKISAQEAILSGPTGRARLRFDARPEMGAGKTSAEPSGAAVSGNRPDLAEAFAARRVGENRWQFDREGLLEYYDELRDEPQRLLTVFDSMKPVYEPEGTISGYHLHIEGEENFFRAAGLSEGDVVRAVNHVPMTNRRRAEHFIRRFVEEGLETVVLQVERNGETLQLEYLIGE